MPLILQERVSLKPFQTFGVDAVARYLARVDCEEDLAQAVGLAERHALPWMVLGGGSNVLFADDYPGVVVQACLRGVQELDGAQDARLVRVAAGEPWPALVADFLARGWHGLENLALIPGSAGAAPIQNIGAYGVELAERLHSVTVWRAADGAVREVPLAQCGFGYRDSAFKHGGGGEVIVAVTLRLPLRWEPVTGYAELARELGPQAGAAQPAQIYAAVCAIRRRKLPDPAQWGNAGSFFKNPVVPRARHAALLERFPSLVSYPLGGGRFKLAAGWLIEACGLKGVQRGRAGVHEAQALVLVNRGGASGREILALAQDVRERVLERFGVALEPEVRVVQGAATV